MSYILTLDCETTGATNKTKGNPFCEANRLCLVGAYDGSIYRTFDIEYSGRPYSDALSELKRLVEESELLIGFNIKFDLHWIRRYVNNIVFPPVWDCQLGEFLLSHQRLTYPSLNEVCSVRNLGSKYDVVATEYWGIGIDTDRVPREVLEPYLQQDVDLTYRLYLDQKKRGLDYTGLFKLQCQDLLVLEEMEWNGMLFDESEAEKQAKLVEEELKQIDDKLNEIVQVPDFQWTSNDWISCLLYGGMALQECRVPTTRILKDGTVKHGEKWGHKELHFTTLVKPLPRSETLPTKKYSDRELELENAKRLAEGKKPYVRHYSTDEGTLRSLKAKGKAKAIIECLLRRSELDKLLTTYYRGIPKTIQDKGWQRGNLHGQLNQCMARTGRLSSSGPNLQNFCKEAKRLVRSRYVC